MGLIEALDVMDLGFLWLDDDLLVRKHNQAYRRLLDLGDEEVFVGRPYQEVIKFLLERGEFINAEDHESYLSSRFKSMQAKEVYCADRVRPNGVVLRVTAKPLDSGGYVFTYLDITRESRALEEVQRNAKATVVAMANFAEHRDMDTGVHVLRVARLVGQTARNLHKHGKYVEIIDESFIEHVSTASILHDVGKIATPDRVLLKEGPLTFEERELMKLHAAMGAQLLKQARGMMGESKYLQLGEEVALTHHEWFDGSGYPNGLRGDDIPLAGRISAIADVFDALTSRRPYKAPWSAEQAIAEINRHRGTQFDPVVVDAFEEVIRERELISLVEWTEAMSVGNHHIDEQHRILMDTINQLASAESQNDRPVLAMIVDELIAYAAFHFHFEEQLMQDCGFPRVDAHRQEHHIFTTWVSGVRDEFIHLRRDQLGVRILNFLRDWLRDHILGEDQKYAPYVAMAGQSRI
ncbi:MAG TPA: bacteriohemerythrin [Rhodocyclaceae bacterium]|nr:bacteriohemerythrin [Rhodocyclaceae bacterium]